MSIAAGLRAHREAAGIPVVDLAAATGLEAECFIRVERGEGAPVNVEAYLRALLLAGEAKAFLNYRWAAETRRWIDRLKAAR